MASGPQDTARGFRILCNWGSGYWPFNVKNWGPSVLGCWRWESILGYWGWGGDQWWPVQKGIWRGQEAELRGREAEAEGGGGYFRWMALITGLLAANQSYCFVQQNILNSSAFGSWSLEWPWVYSRRRNVRSVQHTDLAIWKQCCSSVHHMDMAVKGLKNTPCKKINKTTYGSAMDFKGDLTEGSP